VVTEGMVYLQIVHYSPPIWTKRLIYLTDPDKELAFEERTPSLKRCWAFATSILSSWPVTGNSRKLNENSSYIPTVQDGYWTT
jgi:hypothetical protein